MWVFTLLFKFHLSVLVVQLTIHMQGTVIALPIEVFCKSHTIKSALSFLPTRLSLEP